MKLLISNDDGIFAQGIRSLANHLAEAGHEVTVVCPDQERSATGHGLTLHQPIRAELIEAVFHSTVKAWACSGTPADCVKLALFGLLDERPDFVLAGVNHGPNLGTDVLYSGTVSAAMEGMIEGIPSIAFSLGNYSSREFEPAVKFARTLLAQFEQQPSPKTMLLNVNIPAVEESQIVGVTLARQGIRRYIDTFEKRVDPRGKSYYWLAGEVLEEVEQAQDSDLAAHFPTDVEALRKNYISITPLQYNFTCVVGLKTLQDWTLETGY
ncbi:MAG: 5'/3'-nucleotidase SurE [Microcoleaceae cyanobacterium]